MTDNCEHKQKTLFVQHCDRINKKGLHFKNHPKCTDKCNPIEIKNPKFFDNVLKDVFIKKGIKNMYDKINYLKNLDTIERCSECEVIIDD